MSGYIPHLIAKYATGFDNQLQPWLNPQDSQQVLLDGFVYRGVWEKRQGYSQYADGGLGTAPITESRMVHTITVPPVTPPDGVTATFSFTIDPADSPVSRGSIIVTDTDNMTVVTQTIQDDGVGGTLTGSDGTIDTAINYTNLATPLTVTFTAPPLITDTVSLSFDVHQGLPVSGIMNFYTESNSKELIVSDRNYVNRFNPITNRLEDISPTTLLSGTPHDFMSWTNYSAPNSDVRLLFVNNKNPIQRYDGTTVSPYPVYLSLGTPVPAGAFATGDGTVGAYVWAVPFPVFPGSVTIKTAGKGDTTDDLFGNLVGTDSTGTIDYLSGAISLTYTTLVPVAQPITIDYTPLENPIDTCLHIFQFKDRLVIFAPTIMGKFFGKRLLISGTGAQGDMFVQEALGAGLIDIPDDSFINSADFNRDDLLFFTFLTAWTLKYSGNDIVPFEPNKLDSSRGTQAPHGTITYLNVTTGVSANGFIGCDGYSVDRTDNKIPKYSYNEIDITNFDLCFAGTVDEDRDHYLIHPSPGQERSDRILITNYEELNYSVYRLPLSCMGNYFLTKSVTWNDLAIYDSWEEMAAVYSSWGAFAFQSQTPIGIGGGHNGEIVQLNTDESQDYPVVIRDVVQDGTEYLITTDFQDWVLNDYVYLAGMAGSVQLNNKQGFISEVITPNYSFRFRPDTVMPIETIGAYVPNTGQASKVIIFASLTKKFNPFAMKDKKVQCGWLYFYVSSTETMLTEADEEGIEQPVKAILKVRVIINDTEEYTDIPISNTNFYSVDLSNQSTEIGIKKWNKIWINQTSRFIQFQVYNAQAGAKVQIHAMMPGFKPVGRMI